MPPGSDTPAEPNDPQSSVALSIEAVLDVLTKGTIEEQGLLPWSSNYTFLVTVSHNDLTLPAVYKPRRGERPLWDFQQGSLYRRERAAFLVSNALGWFLVPPTVIRDGPRGLGSVQFYIDCDHDEHYLTFREQCEPEGRRIALFDVLTNNADRKAGHCVRDAEGRVWAIDHGLTFHSDPKLRTVIWDFAGEEIEEELQADLRRLQGALKEGESLREGLSELLTPAELRALDRRLARLLATGVYPDPGPGRHMPWPPI